MDVAPSLVRTTAVRERVTIVSATGEQLDLFSLEARVEALEWSPDGHNLMILGADLGADVSGAEGGYALRGALSGPTWLPEVASSDAQKISGDGFIVGLTAKARQRR